MDDNNDDFCIVDQDSCALNGGRWTETCLPRSFADDRGDDFVSETCIGGDYRGGLNR